MRHPPRHGRTPSRLAGSLVLPPQCVHIVAPCKQRPEQRELRLARRAPVDLGPLRHRLCPIGKQRRRPGRGRSSPMRVGSSRPNSRRSRAFSARSCASSARSAVASAMPASASTALRAEVMAARRSRRPDDLPSPHGGRVEVPRRSNVRTRVRPARHVRRDQPPRRIGDRGTPTEPIRTDFNGTEGKYVATELRARQVVVATMTTTSSLIAGSPRE